MTVAVVELEQPEVRVEHADAVGGGLCGLADAQP